MHSYGFHNAIWFYTYCSATTKLYQPISMVFVKDYFLQCNVFFFQPSLEILSDELNILPQTFLLLAKSL